MLQIVENQRVFFNSQETKSRSFRITQLKKLKKALQDNEEKLYASISKDFSKSNFETYISELMFVYRTIDEAIHRLPNWSRTKRVSTNMLNFPAKSYIIPEPLGVCLVIGAWNYPYLLTLSPLVAALAAGNTVVIKPSEMTAECSATLVAMFAENFDPSYIAVVEGGIPETTDLLSQKFDKIFFTGSTAVGKIVYEAAAKNLTPVTLELGGKSPVFVLEDCNLKMTVKRLVWAKFLNAGQTCIAPDYVLVHESVEKEFLNLVKSEIEKEHLSIDNGNYTQIINQKNFNRLEALIDSKKVFTGGQTNASNRVIEPTVLQNVTFIDNIMKDEIFGPILPVVSFTSLEEAIDNVQTLPKPLSCYVFTKSHSKKKEILNRISFGGGAVNEAVMHLSNHHLPFGGVGNSGIGNYHGEAGFRTFSHYKSILEKPTWIEFPLKYYPHTKGKLKWIKRFMKL